MHLVEMLASLLLLLCAVRAPNTDKQKQKPGEAVS
jgi:hypothetical protein